MEKIFPFLIALAALALLYILWCLIEPFFLDMDRAVLKKPAKASDSGEIAVKKLPLIPDGAKDDPDFRFFFFSDIHAEWCPVTASRLCKSIRKQHAISPLDAVIFGGDITTYPGNASIGYKYINTVNICCNELGIPFYGISGNHDVLISDYETSASLTNLNGRTILMTSPVTGRKAVLAGVPDSGTRKLEWPSIPSTEGNEPVILIAHDPDTLIHIEPGKRPDYMLAGHLHGGQMKFPFRIEFRVLRKKDKLPNMGAVQGVYDISGTSVFISRGLGCGLLPFRFLSVPEATVVEICL